MPKAKQKYPQNPVAIGSLPHAGSYEQKNGKTRRADQPQKPPVRASVKRAEAKAEAKAKAKEAAEAAAKEKQGKSAGAKSKDATPATDSRGNVTSLPGKNKE